VERVGAGSHVPRIENKIKTIKERLRAVLNTLPYLLPHLLIAWLVYYVVGRMNGMPCNTRVDPTPAREILLGRKVSFGKDLALGFGDYVQLHPIAEKTNTMASRTEGALALMPEGNGSGTWWFWTLGTKKPVARNYWTALPLPAEVISHVNNAARKGKVPVYGGAAETIAEHQLQDETLPGMPVPPARQPPAPGPEMDHADNTTAPVTETIFRVSIDSFARKTSMDWTLDCDSRWEDRRIL
jgi:hypothetical protein